MPTALVLAVLVLAACSEQSRVDPDATVRIGGTVRAPDGSPLAGRPVKLGAGVGVGDGLVAVLTLGLSCVSGSCTGDVFATSTDISGRYEFVLKGRDTRSTFGEAVTELVSVSAAPGPGQVSGAATSARFKVQVEDVRIPVLDLVDPGLVVAPATDIMVRWSTPRPGPFDVTFEVAQPVPVWQVTARQGSATVDPRVLEDTSGRVVVAGGSVDRIEGSDVAVRWRSPGAPYAAGAGPPPSRGRSCRYLGAAGTASAAQAGGCELTDGDLTGPATPPPVCPGQPAGDTPSMSRGGCASPAFVVVDLGQPVAAELVVVRGCSGGCSVDVSADGTEYRPAGAASDGYGLVALGGKPVRTVKVGLGAGPGTRLAEVSVWGPRPAAPSLLSLAPAERARVGRGFGGGAKGGGLPVALVVVAIALLGSTLAGAGFVAGRVARDG